MVKITTKKITEIKKPELKYSIDNNIAARFSPRFFSQDKISDKDLESIFEASRWSPSAFNAQPWIFYYSIKGSSGFEKISKSLLEGNNWAKEASVLIIACYIDSGSHGKNNYAEYDLGQAVFSLVYQAQTLGFYCHQMAGFDKKIIIKNLNLVNPTIPKTIIALGKIGDYTKAPKEIVTSDNIKRDRKKIVVIKL